MEEVSMQYLEGFGRAKMAEELLGWVEELIEKAKFLRAKERGEVPEKDFKI